MARGIGDKRGGIAGLIRLIDEHGGALEYDLMTRAGAVLDDVPARIPWTALRSFVGHLDAGSALVRELSPEIARFVSPANAAAMMADLIDTVAYFRWESSASRAGKGRRKPKKPKPYPRPGDKERRGTVIGRDPIPISEFDEWWEGGA